MAADFDADARAEVEEKIQKAFGLKIRLGPPIVPVSGETNYVQLTERIRQAVLQLANGFPLDDLSDNFR